MPIESTGGSARLRRPMGHITVCAVYAPTHGMSRRCRIASPVLSRSISGRAGTSEIAACIVNPDRCVSPSLAGYSPVAKSSCARPVRILRTADDLGRRRYQAELAGWR